LRHVLSNGLTVIAEEVRSAPVVALQAWVQVGSADESDREAGLAHLHEHMLFKGTSTRGPGELARLVEGRGGEINAWTSFDQTVYHLVLASRFFAEGLDVLTDAILDAAFDPGELAREIEVVLEEIKRSLDMPSRKLSRELFGLAYRNHTYGRPVIGFEETVRSFTRDDILAFYRRHYTPDNVVFVVVGDIGAEEAIRAVEARWAGATQKHGGRVTRPVEPPQAGARARVVREALKESHLALAWPIPAIRSEDVPVLDVISTVLGHGEGARLPLELRREKRLVEEAYAYAYTPRDPGLLVAGATLRAENLEATARELLRQVYRLRREGVSPGELEVAKRLLESEAIWQRETVQGMARKLGFFESVAGSLDYEAEYYERVRRVTVEGLREAAERYLASERLTAVALTGTEATLGEDRLRELADEEEARIRGTAKTALSGTTPAPAPRRPAAAPRGRTPGPAGIYRETLPSGARVLVKPEPAVPLVAVRAVFAGGLRHEDERSNGVHQLLGRLFTQGTEERDAKAFAAATDALAATIRGYAGRNSFGLRGDFLAAEFEPSFRLFAECLVKPAFAAAEVERERAHQLQEIRSREDHPSSVAFRLFAKTLFRAHPYRLDLLGEEASVAALGPLELSSWYRRRYGPSNLVLSVVGDVDVDAAFALCAELFGAPGPALEAPPVVPVEPPLDGPRRAEQRLPKQQAHLVLGFPGLRVHDPDRHALEVLAGVLAGQGGRLFTELRDKRSMAYSVTAFSLEGLDPGYFAVYMGTSPEKVEAAVEGIRTELGKVVADRIPEEELDRARRYLIGTHAIGLQKNASRAAVIGFDEAYGVGAESFARYPERVEAVNGDRVLEVARKVIDLDRTVLSLVTP
jgi:zinc protease